MVLYDCFKLLYAYLKERDKVPECYSCLKMIVQAHLHVVFFPIFCIKRASLKRDDSIYIWNYCKTWSRNVLRLKFLHKMFYNSQFKKYNCNSTRSYNWKIWVGIPSYIKFPCTQQINKCSKSTIKTSKKYAHMFKVNTVFLQSHTKLQYLYHERGKSFSRLLMEVLNKLKN